MSRNIYFCGSIRAGRGDADLYGRIVKMLETYGKVPAFRCQTCPKIYLNKYYRTLS